MSSTTCEVRPLCQPPETLVSQIRTQAGAQHTAYPGMVDALVQHEGIGLVCGYDDEGAPVALGKGGARHLHTGEVTGADPLQPYAPADPNLV